MSQEIYYPKCEINRYVGIECNTIPTLKRYNLCEKHRCIIDNCNGFRYTVMDGHYAACFGTRICLDNKLLYCSDHKCKDKNCIGKRLNLGYCEEHICKYDGCFEHSFSWGYCDKHTCCRDTCREVIIHKRKHCKKHECRHVGCFSEYKNEYTKTCEYHSYLCEFCKKSVIDEWLTLTLHQDCACDVGICINPKGSNSMFCNEHKSLDKDTESNTSSGLITIDSSQMF